MNYYLTATGFLNIRRRVGGREGFDPGRQLIPNRATNTYVTCSCLRNLLRASLLFSTPFLITPISQFLKQVKGSTAAAA
jgi:hypothetical protein